MSYSRVNYSILELESNSITILYPIEIKIKYLSMAKKSIIEREKNRQKLVIKYLKKRHILKTQMKKAEFLEEKLTIQRKLQQLPRNSSPVRLRNRCMITGRSRGYFKDFGLSRHVLREMAHQGFLPGITKSSW